MDSDDKQSRPARVKHCMSLSRCLGLIFSRHSDGGLSIFFSVIGYHHPTTFLDLGHTDTCISWYVLHPLGSKYTFIPPPVTQSDARNYWHGSHGWLSLVCWQCLFEIANIHSGLARLDRSHRASHYYIFIRTSTTACCIYQLPLYLGHVFKFQSFCVRAAS